MRVPLRVLLWLCAACGGQAEVLRSPDGGDELRDLGDDDGGGLDADVSDAGACTEVPVFDDRFDDGDLASGDGGGFLPLSNVDGEGNGTVVEVNDTLVISTSNNGTGAEPLHGVISLAPVATTGALRVRWQVERADLPRWNGIVLSVQGDTRHWGRSRLGVAIQIRGDAGGVPGNVELTSLPEPAGGPHASIPYAISELEDGFVVTLDLSDGGWSFRVDGLLPGVEPIDAAGPWAAGADLASMLGESRHLGVFLQGDNTDVDPRELTLSRLTATETRCP